MVNKIIFFKSGRVIAAIYSDPLAMKDIKCLSLGKLSNEE